MTSAINEGDPTEPGVFERDLAERSDMDSIRTTARGGRESGPHVAPGQRLGRYEVVGLLGRGGMGTVLRAHDPVLDRPVAIKLLHRGTGERQAQRLRREARAMARLSHVNIVQVFEVGEALGRWFIAMELVEGQTLAQWQRGEHGWRERLDAYLQAGAGLAGAHAAGLVHRDFKPANCLIDHEGRVRVLDFGIVRTTDASLDEVEEPVGPVSVPKADSLTRTGAMMGTVAYMSLEQLGGKSADERSDQFGFCVALYEALYGERPFEGDATGALVTSLSTGTVRPAPRGTAVPERVRRVVLRGLSREPHDRWPSMDALLVALRRAAEPTRTRATVITVVLAGAGLLTSLVWWGLSRSPDFEPSACAAGTSHFEGIWDEARRERLRQRLIETELPYAEDTWHGVRAHIDAFQQRWLATQQELCKSTMARPEQEHARFDATMACLIQQREELDQLVAVLDAGASETIEHAVRAAVALPDPAACGERASGSGLDPPAEHAEQVGEIRRALARAHALENAGRHEVAALEVEGQLGEAEAIGYGPLLAELEHTLGRIERKLGRAEAAGRHLSSAHFRALEHGQGRIAINAALEQVTLLQLSDIDEARKWLRHARTGLERGEGEPSQWIGFHHANGMILHRVGSYAEASEQFERALQLALSPERSGRNVDAMINNLAVVRLREGDYTTAADLLRRALAIRLDEVGPSHPGVVRAKLNLASVLNSSGEHEEALALLEDAVETTEALHGPESPNLVGGLHTMGNVRAGLGELSSAREAFERAIAIARQSGRDEEIEHAHLLNDYSLVLMAQDDFRGSRVALERALEIFAQVMGDEHEAPANLLLFNLGELHRIQGELEAALEHYERVESLRTEIHGEDSPQTARARARRAQCLVGLGRHEDAARVARGALEVLERDDEEHGEYVASAQFVLARARLELDGERAAAEALARRALESLPTGSADVGARRLRESIEQWLAELG